MRAVTGLLLLLPILFAEATQTFLNVTGLQRLTRLSEVNHLLIQSSSVLGVFIHDGNCDREGCSDFETTLLNFYDESKHLAMFAVLDCRDNLKNDPESQPYIFECAEENLSKLPLVTYFVSPAVRMNLKTQKFYPLLKFDHKGPYEVEKLKERLLEVQPSYSFHLLDANTYNKYTEVESSIPESNRTKIPRVMLFAENESRSLDFKLITQKFRHQGVFLEIAPLFDSQELVPGSYRDMSRPFLVVDKHNEHGEKETEIFRNTKTFTDLEQALTKSLAKVPKNIYINYGVENVHENVEEIRQMEDAQRENRFLKISNETILENFLSHKVHESFLIAVFYYFEPSSYSRETLDILATFPEVFLIGHTTADIFLPFIKNKIDNPDFFTKISNSSMLKNGGLAVFSLGEFKERINNLVVFDSLNLTEIMIEISKRWASPFVKKLEENELEKHAIETLQRHKAFMVYLTTPEIGLSFEYIMAASDPRLQDILSFSYYIGKDERMARSLRLQGIEDFPKLVLVFYTTQSYMSFEYFNIEPMADQTGNGYKDYGTIVKTLNDTANVYRRFIADTNLTLSELDELSLSKIPETSYVRDQILFLLVDDDDIDYKRKVYTLKIGVVTSGLKGYFVKTSCYDTMESLGIDPEELNLALYDRKKATVTVVEVEDFSSQVLKKQIQNLRNGLGKKVKLSLFESYISSKDCSYGGTDTQATKKDVEEAEKPDL